MLTDNLIKENLSISYLMIVSSINGFSPERRWRDSDSVDVELVNNGRLDPICTKIEGRIAVQLKATINWTENDDDDTISYVLDVKNYNDLRATAVVVPRILVVLCLPTIEPDWLGVSDSELILRKSAYWYSLRGLPSTTNQNTVTVRIPKQNLLTKVALRELMVRVQCEEDI